MDIVIPYVDMDDPSWQDIFLASKHLPTRPGVRDAMLKGFKNRFASYGLFKYWFRALEANFQSPYTVHLLLMQGSQRPAFLKEDPRIVIHYHDEFMEPQLRPSFNSSAIELCAIHRLQLSPVFLLANDDMYFNAPCDEFDFRDGDAPLTRIEERPPYGDGLFQIALENGRRLVAKDAGAECPRYKWHHVIQAYNDSYCKAFLERHWAYIVPRLGKTRGVRDVNHLMLMIAQDFNGVSRDDPRYPYTGYYACPRLKEVPREELVQHKVLCLNDTGGQGIGDARAYLEWRYPEKCSLER